MVPLLSPIVLRHDIAEQIWNDTLAIAMRSNIPAKCQVLGEAIPIYAMKPDDGIPDPFLDVILVARRICYPPEDTYEHERPVLPELIFWLQPPMFDDFYGARIGQAPHGSQKRVVATIAR